MRVIIAFCNASSVFLSGSGLGLVLGFKRLLRGVDAYLLTTNMKYLPKTKKGQVFLATFVSAVSYYTFDHFSSAQLKREIDEKLKREFGLKLVQPQDQIDKIKVFIAPSFYAMNWFNIYYRPFLYVGGMDYEVEQMELNTDFLIKVSKVVREAREKWTYQEEKIRNRSWIEYILGGKVPTRQILQANREFKGIIGIGPEVYEQVEIGYKHGLKCVKNECDSDCFPNNENTEHDQEISTDA